jgi:hypothetical protein
MMSFEGVVSVPVAVDLINIQFYDADDKFLGVGGAVVSPGGSFTDNVSWENPTSDLKIKFACQKIG